jgi:hypothetical protein
MRKIYLKWRWLPLLNLSHFSHILALYRFNWRPYVPICLSKVHHSASIKEERREYLLPFFTDKRWHCTTKLQVKVQRIGSLILRGGTNFRNEHSPNCYLSYIYYTCPYQCILVSFLYEMDHGNNTSSEQKYSIWKERYTTFYENLSCSVLVNSLLDLWLVR